MSEQENYLVKLLLIFFIFEVGLKRFLFYCELLQSVLKTKRKRTKAVSPNIRFWTQNVFSKTVKILAIKFRCPLFGLGYIHTIIKINKINIQMYLSNNLNPINGKSN